MNALTGNVVLLETEGDISIVEVDVQGDRITSLVLESAETAGYLAPGSPVTVLFKESEVSIGIAPYAGLSIRNRLPCAVRAINQGRILSHLILDYKGRTLHSLISTHALLDMRLQPGMRVEALIKATEVSLAERDVRL